jgi:hypothetical protein
VWRTSSSRWTPQFRSGKKTLQAEVPVDQFLGEVHGAGSSMYATGGILSRRVSAMDHAQFQPGWKCPDGWGKAAPRGEAGAWSIAPWEVATRAVDRVSGSSFGHRTADGLCATLLPDDPPYTDFGPDQLDRVFLSAEANAGCGRATCMRADNK